MKTIITLSFLICSLTVFGQRKHKTIKVLQKDTTHRYWLYEAAFKVDSGCSNTCHRTFEKFSSKAADFDDVKYQVAKYVQPDKLISLKVNSITEI